VNGGVEDPLGPEGAASATIGEARYRQVLGHFATGVTVVAAVHQGQPVGLSVNSFTSVSLDPPLVAFCAARQSSTWPRIRAVGGFCVNVLSEHQEDISRVFATRGQEKFRGVGWRPAPSGAPVLTGVLAWIDCSVDAEHDAGDHVLVIGRVRELDVLEERGPLIFYRGGYGRFEP
jgi:3-hydroxy-9,10-secoandrosta-1,3,5(10)-triene-9,17-dione monooxygenase reductase component